MRTFAAIFIFSLSVLSLGCSWVSIPSLESSTCSEARVAARKFYSFHFGNGLRPSLENLVARKPMMTTALGDRLSTESAGEVDYFTATADYPKAFRIGGCEELSANDVRFEILLFWKDTERSEERTVFGRFKKLDDKWLIDEVRNDRR